MFDTEDVRKKISELIQGNFGSWEIGITDDIKKKKLPEEKGGVRYYWDMGSSDAARKLKMDYIEVGCSESPQSDDWGNNLFVKRAQ